MNTSQKLNYIAGKLGLIPAFGDSIGCAVNKAELALCQKYATQALASHEALLDLLHRVSAFENRLISSPDGGPKLAADIRDAIKLAEARNARGLPLHFLQFAEDCQWLRETHLKAISFPPFRSAMIHGNEDCPQMVELFARENPLHTDLPIAIYVIGEDNKLRTA